LKRKSNASQSKTTAISSDRDLVVSGSIL